MQKPFELQNIKNVAVFGMGRSGVAAVRLLKEFGLAVTAVNEGEVDGWKDKDGLSQLLDVSAMVTQDRASEVFAKTDLIILSPGIPSTHAILQQAHQKNVKIISEIELAFWVTHSVPVVAITGTNGKTTTTTMIDEVLRAAGKKVFCGGNIGVPYCDMALAMLRGERFDWAVIEVSSFQLETIEKFHPHIALMLNLTENHTERYSNMRDYGLAKLNILKNVTAKDHLIVGEESGMQWLEWAKSYPMTMHRFSKQALPKEFLERIDFSRSRLVGSHNQANFYCAFKVLDLLGLLDVGGFQQFVNQFKGVAHRLEFVREWQGLKIYNDAKSTNAQALTTALAAFESLAGQVHLVMGGKLRNENDRFLPALRAFAGRVETILLMGETARRLEAELNPVFRTEVVGDLSGLSAYLKYHEPKGVLVFSPGHPSFDQFKNYVDRGEKFKATMLEL